MTTTPKALLQAKYAETAETRQYPAPDVNARASIDKFTATNVTATLSTISVSIVESGKTAGVGNRVTMTKQIQPGATYTFPELVGHILEPNDFISTLCDKDSAIVLRISGRQFT